METIKLALAGFLFLSAISLALWFCWMWARLLTYILEDIAEEINKAKQKSKAARERASDYIIERDRIFRDPLYIPFYVGQELYKDSDTFADL